MGTALKDKRQSRWMKTALPLTGGMIVGIAYGMLQRGDSDHFEAVTFSVDAALLVAFLYILAGILLAVGLVSPSIGARFLEVEDAEELREQRKLLMTSSMSLFALGIALAILVLSEPLGLVPVPIAATAAGVLVVFAAGLTRFEMRLADELLRIVTSEAAARTYNLLFVVGGGWSMLAHLDFVSPPAPLDWLTMFWGIAFIATYWTWSARGLLTPR